MNQLAPVAIPQVRLISVSPDIARSWLANKANYQRKVSERTVLSYSDLITKKQWKLTPNAPIALSPCGQVVDGQHRLCAVVKANVPTDMYVMEGVSEDIFDVLDRGRARTLPQVAAMAGSSFAAAYQIASVNSLLWKIKYHSSLNSTWGSSEISAVIERFNSQMELTFPPGLTGRGPFKGASLRGAVLRAFICMPEREEEISEFLKVVVDGYPSEKISEGMEMAFMLRNVLLDSLSNRAGKGKIHRHRLWCSSLKALRYFLSGTKVRHKHNLAYGPMSSQPFPIPLDRKPSYQSFLDWAD